MNSVIKFFGVASMCFGLLSVFAGNNFKIEGVVFIDANKDCVWNPGEQVLHDWPIHIHEGEQSIQLSTDTRGAYHVELRPGNYEFTIDRPASTLDQQHCTSQLDQLQVGTYYRINFPISEEEYQLMTQEEETEDGGDPQSIVIIEDDIMEIDDKDFDEKKIQAVSIALTEQPTGSTDQQ